MFEIEEEERVAKGPSRQSCQREKSKGSGQKGLGIQGSSARPILLEGLKIL
jgi:hypothetical protein